jgi:Diacylglycerol kinase
MLPLLKRAPKRLAKSFGYCWDGLKAMFRKEESFRLETIAFCILLLVLIACPWPIWKKLFLLGSYLLIPFAELVNSAIEDVCDLVTREQSPYVKTAKDKGALAVLFAIIINAFVLVALILV